MDILYLIIPCYNEQDVLREAAARTAAELDCFIREGSLSDYSRILFVDDGSTDSTWDIITALHSENERFTGIRLSHNSGQQNALFAGMMEAKNHANIMISLDADLQDDLSVLRMMLGEYRQGCDIVYGVKAPVHNEKRYRKFLADSFYRLMRLLDVDMVSHHSSCRLMSRRAVEVLSTYHEVNLFLPALVRKLGFQHSIVHYGQNERFAGKTKYSLGKLFTLALEAITSFSMRPLRLISWCSAASLLAAFGITLYWAVLCIEGRFNGWLLVWASVWAVGGLTLAATGVLSEYLGKTYLETKRRPHYHIDQSLLT